MYARTQAAKRHRPASPRTTSPRLPGTAAWYTASPQSVFAEAAWTPDPATVLRLYTELDKGGS